MWRVCVILNALFLTLSCAVSVVPYAILQNHFVAYADPTAKPLPFISQVAIHLGWVIPLVLILAWVIAVFHLAYWHRKPLPRYLISLDTSLAVFFGTTLMMFFILGGVLPFVPIITGMRSL